MMPSQSFHNNSTQFKIHINTHSEVRIQNTHHIFIYIFIYILILLKLKLSAHPLTAPAISLTLPEKSLDRFSILVAKLLPCLLKG